MEPQADRELGVITAYPRPSRTPDLLTQTNKIAFQQLVSLRKNAAKETDRLVAVLPPIAPPEVPWLDYSLQIHKNSLAELPGELPSDILIPRNHWLLIGRRPFTDEHLGLCLVLKHESISRLHAALINQDGVLYACDLSEHNPPYVIKGASITPVGQEPEKISEKDYISFGSLLFALQKH